MQVGIKSKETCTKFQPLSCVHRFLYFTYVFPYSNWDSQSPVIRINIMQKRRMKLAVQCCSLVYIRRNRPHHAKTCLRAYADSEGSDQTAHPRSLIRVFPVANRIIGYYRKYDWRGKARRILWAYAGWSESSHFCACSKALFSLPRPRYHFIFLLMIQVDDKQINVIWSKVRSIFFCACTSKITAVVLPF